MSGTKSKSKSYARNLAEAGYDNFLILDREGAKEVLTDRRVELLETIREEEPESISELADLTDRSIQAVSRDLDILWANTVVRFEEGPGGGKRPILDQDHIFVEPVLSVE